MSRRASPQFLAALLVLLLFTAWISWRAKALEQDIGGDIRKIPLVGKSAPDFHLPDLNGHTVAPSDFHGKKLVLAFGASWNNGTHPALSALGAFYQQNHKPESDYDVAFVSVDENQSDARNLAAQLKLPFPVLLDPAQSTAKAYGVRMIPTVVLIDGTGKVTFGRAGFQQGNLFELAPELGVTNYRMEFGGQGVRRRD